MDAGGERGFTCSASELVDEETANQAADETYECGDGDGRRWLAEGDAADENDCFDAYEGDV